MIRDTRASSSERFRWDGLLAETVSPEGWVDYDAFYARFASDDERRFLATTEVDVEFVDYDWSLNRR